MNSMVLFFCYIIQEIQFIAVEDAGSRELVLQNHSVCESTINWRKHKYFVNLHIWIIRLYFLQLFQCGGKNAYLSLLGHPGWRYRIWIH